MSRSDAPDFGPPKSETALLVAAMSPPSLVFTAVLAVMLLYFPARSRALSPPARAGTAVIDGRLDVSIVGPALKHWGISTFSAAFVPDIDRSTYAQRIRDADDAETLCAALAGADGRDATIDLARADGDGDLEHRSGDETQLVFRIDVPRLQAAAQGVVYVCSSPVLAVIARGNYPDERFERVTDKRFRWMSQPLTLHPGEAARLVGTASIDASEW